MCILETLLNRAGSNVHKTEGEVEWRTTRGNESPLCHLKRTPASWRQFQNAPERNHAGIHGKGFVPNVRFSNNVRTVRSKLGGTIETRGRHDCWNCCWRHPAEQPRVLVFQPPPFPEPGCTPRRHRRLLVLRRGLWALVTAPLVQRGEQLRCYHPAASRTAPHSIIPKQFFQSTFIVGCGEAHSS